jgi:3-oxoacyl-[acyl-carrier-protein] synthase II
VVSEGAGVIILESEAHALKRGAKPLAILRGAAYLGDGQHMTQPQAKSMVQVMELALARGKVSREEIQYVNAHATGTVLGDREEAEATAEMFGPNIPMSSLKGHLGHSLAACGAMDLIASIEMMRSGWLIPTRNLTHVDPLCDKVVHLTEKKEVAVNTIISNNFAFGGMSASAIVSSYQGKT